MNELEQLIILAKNLTIKTELKEYVEKKLAIASSKNIAIVKQRWTNHLHKDRKISTIDPDLLHKLVKSSVVNGFIPAEHQEEVLQSFNNSPSSSYNVDLYRDRLYNLSDEQIKNMCHIIHGLLMEPVAKRILQLSLQHKIEDASLCLKCYLKVSLIILKSVYTPIKEELYFAKINAVLQEFEMSGIDNAIDDLFFTFKETDKINEAIFFLNEHEVEFKHNASALANTPLDPVLKHTIDRYSAFFTYSKEYLKTKVNYPERKKSIQAPEKVLFRDVNDTHKYLAVLKNTTKPIIDETGCFILGPKSKSKGSIVAWYDILKNKGKTNLNLTPYDAAVLINQLIPNLEIDGRSFGNLSRAYNEYMGELKNKIDKI